MGLRHLGRELALQALYQIDLSGDPAREHPAALSANFPADSRARAFAIELVEGVCRERRTLDQHLAEVIENWSIERLSRVDHNVLRIALYELLQQPAIPARVTAPGPESPMKTSAPASARSALPAKLSGFVRPA